MPVLMGSTNPAAPTPDTLVVLKVAADGTAATSGGGGPATIADGADVAQGATTDTAKTDSTQAGTIIAWLKGLIAWAYGRMPASLGQKTKAASLPVVLASDQDTLNVVRPDVRATGQTINSATPSAALSVALNNGEGVTAFNVAGLTASGATLTIEAADDGGTTWFSVNGITPGTGVLFTTLTTDQSFRVNTGGRTNVRLRVSSTGAGTITVAYNASCVSSAVALSSPLPAGTNLLGTAAIDQTTPGTTNAVVATGNVANGVTDAGNPVKMGGKANSSTSNTVSAGQRVDAWLGLNGQFIIGVGGSPAVDGQTTAASLTRADGTSAVLQVAPALYNESTWDRQRPNTTATLFTSGARTSLTGSTDQVNYNGRRLLVMVDVTSAGTGSITPTLQVKDPVSGNYATIWTAATALTANGTYTYYFADGTSGGSFTESKPFSLPARTWRLVVTANNANSVTYSASANIGV